MRRIEALTGQAVIDYYKKEEEELQEIAALLKTNAAGIREKIAHLQAEVKALHSENESLKSKMAPGIPGRRHESGDRGKGREAAGRAVPEVDMNGLRELGDSLKEKLGQGVVVLASAKGGKVNLIAMVTEEAQKKGAHAGNLVKAAAAIVGRRAAGGRPNMAQAGGKKSGQDPGSHCQSAGDPGRTAVILSENV